MTGMCTGCLPLTLNRGQAIVSRATMTDLCPGTHALDSCVRSSPAPACPWRPVRPEPAPGFDQGERRGTAGMTEGSFHSRFVHGIFTVCYTGCPA